jgi:hypothetical protein
VDVRKLPGSHRFPHFDQIPLAVSLLIDGINYDHFPDLGGGRKRKTDSHNTAWRHPVFRAYADRGVLSYEPSAAESATGGR